ncbi:MAG: response regulator [Proteobacteria bacterium]|nr:response regulator [Pseudomonadota bacterium]
MASKTVLLIDDEQSFIEALADALEFEGHRVLKARTAEEGLQLLAREKVDLVTIDIMLDPGQELQDKVNSHNTGLFLCHEITKKYPQIDAFCISVISENETIREIESLGIRFLRKGETPLRTVLDMLRSRLTGIAYSTERDRTGRWR